MKRSASASGKIILSGEYAVVFGYPGIAVPAPFTLTATWDPSPSLAPARFTLSRGERETRHNNLTITYSGIENEDYLHRILDAITEKIGSIHGHLTIENTIPIGRGMGSSTALMIAIGRCLLGPHRREQALAIEDTTNPGHSGLDFAVIWENRPVKFAKESGAEPIDLDLSFLRNAVLIDTGKPNETTPEMVGWVKENSLSPRERAGVRGALQTIALCTERLIAGKSLLTVFPDHHRAQVALGVVPKEVQNLIADIEKIGGAAKVVGAGSQTGGGGMVLALHLKPEKLLTIAKRHGMTTLALTPTHPPSTLPLLT